MSDTILSKSSITISCPLILIIPVAMPFSAVLIVESGVIISAHDTLCIPTTVCT